MAHMLRRPAALLLAVICAIMLFLPQAAAAAPTEFENTLTRLETLEQLATEYRIAGRSSDDVDQLVLSYIRSVSYSGTKWDIFTGTADSAFISYVAQNSPDTAKLRSTGSLLLPNGDSTDFIHMFAVMNINDHSPGSGDMGGWIGDTYQLMTSITSETGTEAELTEIAKAKFRSGGLFGKEDWIADLDGYNLFKAKQVGETWASCFARYFTPALTEKQRVSRFIRSNLGESYSRESTDSASYRSILKSRYRSGAAALILADYGLFNSPDDKYHNAACYAVADYMYETMRAPTPDESTVCIDFANERLLLTVGIVANSREDFSGTVYENGSSLAPGTVFYAKGIRDVENGSFFPTAAVKFTAPARPAAPDAPQLVNADAGSLRFAAGESTEYSIDGGVSWQDSPVFPELTPNTAYSVVCRYQATATSFASDPSQAVSVSTALPTGLYANSRGIYYTAGDKVGGMMAAYYDPDGRMCALQMASLVDGLWCYVPDSVPKEQTVRIFVLDTSFKPLNAAYTLPEAQ